MKFLIIAFAIACTQARPDGDRDASILKFEYEGEPESYHYAYETSNGIQAQAEGKLINANSEYPSLEIKGGSQYTAPDGNVIRTDYIANENGYQPQGSHIPEPPPTPESILRALQYIADHPPPPFNA